MKKLLISGVTVATVVCTCIMPAWADVIRPIGQTTGTPAAAESNTGSAQGLSNRSETGTNNKFTHDGLKEIWA